MTRKIAALVPVLAALAACEGPADSDLSSVLPDERVLVALPTEGDAAARVGEWSEFYLITAQVTEDINGLAGSVLLLVDAITEYPASEVTDTRSVWGPFAEALDPVDTQLWVLKGDDGGYLWGFDQRPKGDTAAEWVTVITGSVEAGATEEASRGEFSVDWSEMTALDPNVRATGVFGVQYDIATTGVSGTASFQDVVFEDQGEPTDAVYAYEQVEGGDGAMDIAIETDMDEGGMTALETLVIRSRWQSSGVGRSDALVQGGDLGDAVAHASECWDASFQSVWYMDDYTPIEEGDAAACVFESAEFAN